MNLILLIVSIYYDDVTDVVYGFLMLACYFLMLVVVGWYSCLDDDWFYMLLVTYMEVWMVFDALYFFHVNMY